MNDSNGTHGVCSSGASLQYMTIASGGGASNFGGTLIVSHNQCGGVNSGTRGVLGGGYSNNTMEYITIGAGGGGASAFGTFAQTNQGPAGVNGGL